MQAVHEAGKPTVVVLLNGRPLTINWIDRNVPAIGEAWFQGELCGTAIADVLFGDYNPSGKLKPGEQKRVNFTLTPSDLMLLNREMQWVVESGRFQVLIGASSDDIRLRGFLRYPLNLGRGRKARGYELPAADS